MNENGLILFDEEDDTGLIRCAICGVSVSSVDEALDLDWAPFFYEGNDQHGPACVDCSNVLMKMDEFGEMEVREEYRGKIFYLDEPLEETGEYVFMGMIYN